MRFTIAATTLFAASAFAEAGMYYTTTTKAAVPVYTTTPCSTSTKAAMPVYTTTKKAAAMPVYYTTTTKAAMPVYTTTPCSTLKPTYKPTYKAPVYESPSPVYVAPVPTTTPCNGTAPVTYAAPMPVYSTSWAYVCPHPEVCHATSSVYAVPYTTPAYVAPAPTYAPAPYGAPNATMPYAPVYTGAASSVNIGAGAVLGLVSLAAIFLA